MQLDRKLNIVIPVYSGAELIECLTCTGTGKVGAVSCMACKGAGKIAAQPSFYVHSAPIGRQVFEAYYLVIAKAWSAITAQGLNSAAAPGVSLLLLRETAKTTLRIEQRAAGQQVANWLDSEGGIEQGLLPEIFRLTNVLMPGPQGWRTVPFDEVRARNLLNPDDLAEVENVLVFFTLASVAPPKRDRAGIIAGVAAMWNAEVTSFNCTEYQNTLPTSKETGSSGEKAIPSATIY